MQFPGAVFLGPCENRMISTIRFQILKELWGNCMRHFWVTEGVGARARPGLAGGGLGWVMEPGVRGLGYEAGGGLGRAFRERRVVKRVLPTERGCMLLVSRIMVRSLACWSVAARPAVSAHVPQSIMRTHDTN